MLETLMRRMSLRRTPLFPDERLMRYYKSLSARFRQDERGHRRFREITDVHPASSSLARQKASPHGLIISDTHGRLHVGCSPSSFTTSENHVFIDMVKSAGEHAPSMGPNTHGGHRVTRSQRIAPLRAPAACRSQAARSESVLLARYLLICGAAAPCARTVATSGSFQSASVNTAGVGRVVSTTAASEETTTARRTVDSGRLALCRIPVVPWTAGWMSSSGSSAAMVTGEATCTIASMP